MNARPPLNPHPTGRKWFCVFLALVALNRHNRLLANPTGMTVVSGSATAQQLGSQLNVTLSQAAVLNWQSFNINAGETTSFLQPSANSVVLNLIGGASPSQIFGNLNANGTVILENTSGFYFGSGSMINVGGSFLATTATLPADFGAGASWQFSGPPPSAQIVNYGQIQVGTGKSLFLIAADIENHGALNAPGGSVDLAAGQSVLVSESPDGRGLSAVVTLPQGTVDNFGRITAAGGDIMMQAKVVNQGGLVQADSVQNQNGVISLVASETLSLGASSQILARGDDSAGGSSGGSITLESDNTFADAAGSKIIATGGANGGNGGNVEISAPDLQSLNSTMNASGQASGIGGTLVLDSASFVLGTSTANGAINVNKAFAGYSAIDLQAAGNISLNTSTLWNLSRSTGESSGQLLLAAGGDITFGKNSGITDANDWGVSLYAGVTGFSDTTPTVQPGLGNIYLNGGSGLNQNGYIQTAQGAISLEAGESILIGKGYVVTTGGGNIYADALGGNIATGTAQVGNNNTGYSIDSDNNTYGVSTVYGGIGTYGGGNLTLTAGGSINPVASDSLAVAGAFGSAPGDVILTAGDQINGTFNVANGTGNLLAGVSVNNGQVTTLNADGSIGTSLVPVTLGLIGGASGAQWNLYAADNLYLLEVRNPEGSANPNAATTSGLFDYSATAAANLWAGNGITLGSVTTSLSGNGASDQTAVYCPSLSLTAGAGGISIFNSIVLFPSSSGSLNISDGGNLTMAGNANPPPTLTMSDSTLTDYADLAGHASTPLHLADPNPVTVDVSGSIYGLDLVVPTFANITVGGSTYNFGFTGQNLSASQTTAITVAGDINYPTTLYAASVPLASADSLPANVLAALTASGDLGATTTLTDNGTSLTINGQMSATALNFLLSPSEGLDTVQLGAVQALYAESQRPAGLALAGPGNFNISALNIALGLSSGINADFPNAPDAALNALSPEGATLNITALGNVDLTATDIANGGLDGGINLNVGGTLDVGGTATSLGSQSAPKGIFTTSGGSVNVTANGDVNVDGSRIAAYDGGNVSVVSQQGDINAGAGGQGYVIFQSLQLDSTTGQLIAIPATIPFSGIIATTVFGSDAALGNISISAPNGNVNSSAGGVLQIAFNNADAANNTITVTAGKDINATGSGVIGYNVKLQAGGDINGVVVGRQSVAVTSQQSVDVTAVSGGNVNISASGTVSGTVIGGGDVSVSGSAIDAAVRGGSVSTSGDTSGATLGSPSVGAAQNVQVADNANTVGANADANDDDELKKKKTIALEQKVSRVSVLLPEKK